MAEKSGKEAHTYTKYEKARIIGARALQLAYGAPPLIEVPKGVIDPLELAELEFDKGVIPITIIREKQGYVEESE
ncbi:MAG: DNA-directed RNA polymerase subunit K [Candidatus Micrarchaeia archaeon]